MDPIVALLRLWLILPIHTHTQGRERVLRCLAGGVLLGLLPPELLTQIRQLGPPVNCRGKSCVWSGLVWSGHR
jgi:hypothetical protein